MFLAIVSEVSLDTPTPISLTQNIDCALVHYLEQLEQIQSQKAERGQGDLVIGIMSA